MRLIAEGVDINDLPLCEDMLAEGEKGEVRFFVDRMLFEAEIDQMEQEILSKGVILTEPIVQDAGMLVVRFQKAVAPLMVIALAVAAVIVIGAGLLGWQLFSWMGKVPWWAWFAAGVGAVYLFVYRPAVITETGKAIGAARRK